ncbi:MAG: saccharopine dehydrogenase NADP-binding domain-containing protein [Pseudomonadota bacterium]
METREATAGSILHRLLIIGATGVFGSRLARHLAQDPRFELLLASRDAGRALALKQDLAATAKAKLTPVALETSSELAPVLKALRPWCVVDCSGPFQEMSFATARAALAAGAHVVDLADASGYLTGYRDAVGHLAKAKRLSAVTGASSTPALSGAVVADLCHGLCEIQDIEIAIAPGGRSPVGPSVIDAILSYAGREVATWRAGKPASARGWQGGRSFAIEGLGRRRGAEVETIDARFLGCRHAVRGGVTFRAALESLPEQLGLELLAALRRFGLAGDLRPLAPLLLRLRALTRLPTSDRGGMRVAVRGVRPDGEAVEREWTLIAEHGQGPCTPILPTAAVIKGLLDHRIGPGAKLAPEVLTLDEILRETDGYSMHIKSRERRLKQPSVSRPRARPDLWATIGSARARITPVSWTLGNQ